MDMDIDPEGFDHFEFDETDLLVIQQEEEIYLSSQQANTQTSEQVDPTVRQFNTSSDINTVNTAAETTTSNLTLSEAERTIENLRFQLHRLELQSSSNGYERYKKELSEAKEILFKKDHDIINLKKELAALREKGPNDSQKRHFPGSSPSPKRPAKPSPFLKPHLSFSQKSSQANTRLVEPLVPPPSPSGFTNMPKLLAMALPVMNPQTNNNNINNNVYVSHKHKNKKRSKSYKMKSKLTETERNNKFLNILFTPIFQEWNIINHGNSKDIHVCLTQARIKYFSDLFSLQFVPSKEECSSIEIYNNLVLLASDISSYLIKSEYADATIRLLLDVLNLCLSICIKENLFKVIQNIIIVVNSLTDNFPVAATYLYKDVIFDKNAILKNITNILHLFSFIQHRSHVLMLEVPDIEKKPMTQIIKCSEIFDITPIELSNQLLEKTMPKETMFIIKSILDLFYGLASRYEKPIFEFLLEDEHFVNLLSIDKPSELVTAAVCVLETNFMGTTCMESYTDTSLTIINRLTDLMTGPQGFWIWKEWYALRFKIMNILLQIVHAQLPSDTLLEIQKIIFTKTNILLEEVNKNFKEFRSEESNPIREQCDGLIKICLQVMYSIIMTCPKDIFQQVPAPCADEVFNFVPLFRKLGITEDHPAYGVLQDIQKYMDVYLSKASKK